jgi:hypothetical protein
MIFTKNVVNNIVEFVDKHCALITRGFYTKNGGGSGDEKCLPVILSKKCVILISSLLFKHPYQLGKWNDDLTKLIRCSKSIFIYPFTWLLH